MGSCKYALAIGLSLLTNASFAALADDVGDADSFGREKNYIGAKSMTAVQLVQDCSAVPSLNPCINISSTGSTPIDQPNVITFKLPAYSTRSLLCHSINVFVNYKFVNNTTTQQQSSFILRPVFTIESPILTRYPSLIDPFTGLPANGKISSSFNTFSDSRSLLPIENAFYSNVMGRECSQGLLTKQLLLGAGWTSSQVASFFANPITVTFSAVGTATRMEFGAYGFSVRMYGD